jgi:hypothetical protein
MRFDYHKIYLPNQLFFRKLFNGSKKKFEEKLYFYITNFLNLQNPKNEFKLKLTTMRYLFTTFMNNEYLEENNYAFIKNIFENVFENTNKLSSSTGRRYNL